MKTTNTKSNFFRIARQMRLIDLGEDMSMAMDGSGECGSMIHTSMNRYRDEELRKHGWTAEEFWDAFNDFNYAEKRMVGV